MVGGHAGQCSGIIPGSILKGHSWQAYGITWDASDQTATCKASVSLAVLSITPAPELAS